MLRLVLEEITPDIVTYRYYPEHDTKYGLVSVNRKTTEMWDKKLAANDEFGSYFVHAISAIRNIIKANKKLPRKRLVAWY